MTSSNIDYATVYFKYKNPTPINGEPTNKALKRLKTELRANASSVDTDLGGGDHGYLGLVLSDVEYARITPASPFIPPTFPGPLVIDPALTAVQQVQARETHKEAIALYRECKNVEKALLRHIQTATEHKYLELMVDEDTGLIEDDIPTVLQYLFTNYGKVTSEQVKERENEVLTIAFNPADPMITISRPIEQLQKKATDAGIPYSEAQLLEFGLTLIKSTRDFEKALGEWHAKPTNQKTWITFKSHFRDAQTELKAIRGPTMQQAGYHHANMLAEQLRVDLNNQQTEMLAMVQGLTQVEDEPHMPREMEVANAATIDVQHQIFELLRTMQEAQSTNTNTTNRGGNRNGTRRCRKTPDDASFPRQVTDKYCWTHGACNHKSDACNRKAPGHRDAATKENRMNGSNAFCNVE